MNWLFRLLGHTGQPLIAIDFITAICFSSDNGLSSSLVTKDQMEVCPLARRMILLFLLNPYPLHYKVAFAFSILLCPHTHQPTLRFAYPFGETYGFTTFRLNTCVG